jgi:hypothetical protein
MQWLKDCKGAIRRFTPSDCPFAIFWPLYCLSFFDLRLLIAHLLSFGYCIVCLSSIYALLKDRKGAIRRRKSEGAIKRPKSNKDRQCNGQKIAKGHSEGVNQKGQSEGVNRRKTDNAMAKR